MLFLTLLVFSQALKTNLVCLRMIRSGPALPPAEELLSCKNTDSNRHKTQLGFCEKQKQTQCLFPLQVLDISNHSQCTVCYVHAFECEPTWIPHTFVLCFKAMWAFTLPTTGCLKDDQIALQMGQLENIKQKKYSVVIQIEISGIVHARIIFCGQLSVSCSEL